MSNDLPEEECIAMWVEVVCDLLRDANLASKYRLKSLSHSNAFDIKYFLRSMDSAFEGKKCQVCQKGKF